MRTRRLKIEAVGDYWQKRVKPRIRLMGAWLDVAGFAPGARVEVTCLTRGVLQIHAQSKEASATESFELRDAPLSPTRVAGIRQAWRGSSCCFFSPSLWMSDAELDQVAARVKGCTAPEIGRAVARAETSAELLEACKEVYAWSQSKSSGDHQTEYAFDFHVLPKLERAIRNAERSTYANA